MSMWGSLYDDLKGLCLGEITPCGFVRGSCVSLVWVNACLSEGFVWGQCGFVGDSQVRLVESLCEVSVGLSEVSVWAVWVCARVPVQSRCESVGNPCRELAWVSGRPCLG